MNTISQSEILLQDANNEVGAFLRKYQVSDILKQCNGYKQKGFSVIQLFAYLVTLYFIIDDTPFQKSGKKTELVSRFFNHVSMKYELGYRILTLLWTDGYSNVPVDFSPLSSGNEKLIVTKAKEYDGRTLAGRIRKQACMKAPELILMMLSKAVAAGHTAKYVLFDSWFATPKGIMDIKNSLDMDVIAMVKKSGKVYYEYDGAQLDVREIFSRCKKRRGR